MIVGLSAISLKQMISHVKKNGVTVPSEHMLSNISSAWHAAALLSMTRLWCLLKSDTPWSGSGTGPTAQESVERPCYLQLREVAQ